MKRNSSLSSPSTNNKKNDTHRVKKTKTEYSKIGSNKMLSTTRRFKFQSFSRQLESITIENFQKRSGFIGLKPGEHSSWFYSSIISWRDINLTAAFKKFCGVLNRIMKSGAVAQLLLIKDEIVRELLGGMLSDKLEKTATIVFTHLLAMLAKDLREEIFEDYFVNIWEALNELLSSSGVENSEVVESIINCQMFYLKLYCDDSLIKDVDKYGKLFIKGLLKSKGAVRKVTVHTLAYYIGRVSVEEFKNLLGSFEFDKQLIPIVGEALSLAVLEDPKLLSIAFVNKGLAEFVCLKVLLNITENDQISLIWDEILKNFPPVNLLIQCVALRKGSKTTKHKEILEFVKADLSIEFALLFALIVKSCDLSTLLSLRGLLIPMLQKVNQQPVVLFLEELKFNLWQAFTGYKFPQRYNIEGNDTFFTLEGKVQSFIIHNDVSNVEFFIKTCNNVLLLKQNESATEYLTDEYLYLALTSQDIQIVTNALLYLQKMHPNNTLVTKLISFTNIPSNLERYREKINLLLSLEKEFVEQTLEQDYVIMFYFLLGACQIKLSLLMPTISRLLNILCGGKRAKIFNLIYTRYLEYVSDPKRDSEIYSIKLAPKVFPSKNKMQDSDETLEKLSSLKKRIETILGDEQVAFGEYFSNFVTNLEYSLASPAYFGNVLKVLSTCPCACSAIDFNYYINVKGLKDGSFKKSIQSNYLSLLSCYSKSSSVDNEKIMELLAIGDDKIQIKLLECLAVTNIWMESFTNLINDNTYKDELANLKTSNSKMDILFSNDTLFNIMTRVIYGRLISKKLAKNKGALQVRRKAFLGFVAIWPTDKISKFIEFTRINNSQFDTNMIVGYLNMLQFVIKYLPSIPEINLLSFNTLVSVFTLEDKRIKSLTLKRLLQLVNKFDLSEQNLEKLFNTFILPLISKFFSDYAQSESSFLDLLLFLSNNYKEILLGKDQIVFNNLLSAIQLDVVNNKVLLKTLMIVDNIVQYINDPRGVILLLESLISKVAKFASISNIGINSTIFSQLIKLILSICNQSIESNILIETILKTLLPLLKLKRVQLEIKTNICQVTSKLLCQISNQAIQEEYFDTVCDLLISITERPLRNGMVMIIGALSINNESYTKSLLVLQELFLEILNSLEVEYDYDKRFQLLSNVKNQSFVLDDHSEKILVHCCLYFIMNEPEELSTRNQAMIFLNDNMWKCIDAYLKYLPIAFRNPIETIRVDYCSLFSKAILLDPKLSVDLSALCGNEESDVFINLGHLQMHRKIRAIRRLCTNLPPNHSINQHFISFMLHWCINRPNAPPINPTLQQEAAKAVGEICEKCSYKQILKTLNYLFKTIEKQAESERSILKVIPFILERMPMSLEVEKLMGKLFILMKDKKNSTEIVRIPIAISLVQLISRLEVIKPGTIDRHLPGIMALLIASLKSKIEDHRKETKEALSKIFLIIEPTKIIPTFIRGMNSILEATGYQRHVMIYTLNTILSATIKSDDQIHEDAMALICDLLNEDFFGKVANERGKTEWTGKVLEAKHCRGFDLVSTMVKIISPSKVDLLLRSFICVGTAIRDTKNLDKLLNVILNAIEERIDLLELMVEISNPNYYINHEINNRDNIFEKWQLLGIKGFTMLIKKISTDVSIVNSNSGLDDNGLLQKMRQICMGHLFGPNSNLAIASLKYLSYTLKWSQYNSCMEEDVSNKKQVLKKSFELIVKSSQKDSSDLISECFKFIMLILRDHYRDVQITDQQLKALLVHTKIHFEELDRQQLTFSLIKAILIFSINSSKYTLELYELMNEISRSLITSQQPVTRQHCRHLMVLFLGECPMSTEKLEQHLQKLLADSSSYEYLSGRLSAREALLLVIKKLHCDVITSLGDRMFLVLTSSYAQEQEQEGLEMIDQVITELANLKNDALIDKLIKMLEKWLLKGQDGIKSAAWRSLSCLLRAYKNGKGISKSFLGKIVNLAKNEIPNNSNDELIINILKSLNELDNNSQLLNILIDKATNSKNMLLLYHLNGLLLKDDNLNDDSQIEILRKCWLFQIKNLSTFQNDYFNRLSECMIKISNEKVSACIEGMARRCTSSQLNILYGFAIQYFTNLKVMKDYDAHLAIKLYYRYVNTLKDILSPNSPLVTSINSLYEERLKGLENFDNIYMSVQKKHIQNKAEQKQSIKRLAVTDPALYNQKKIHKNKKKVELKKKKILVRKLLK